MGQRSRENIMRFLDNGVIDESPTSTWMNLATPLPTTINERTPPLKFLLYSLFRPMGGQKTINIFSHFHGLVPDNNLQAFGVLHNASSTL